MPTTDPTTEPTADPSVDTDTVWALVPTIDPPARALTYLAILEAHRRRPDAAYHAPDAVAAIAGTGLAATTAHLRALATRGLLVKRYYLGEQIGERPPPTKVGYTINLAPLELGKAPK